MATREKEQGGKGGDEEPQADRASSFAEGGAKADTTPDSPKDVEEPAPGVRVVAVRPAWVRVRASDSSVIFEGVMNAGDTYDVPTTEEPPTIRVGESGAVYFTVNGQHYGPAGESGSVTSGLALDAEALTASYAVADLQKDEDLLRYVAELQPSVAAQD